MSSPNPTNITNMKGGVLPLLFVNKLKRKWVRKLSITPTPRTPSPVESPTSPMCDLICEVTKT